MKILSCCALMILLPLFLLSQTQNYKSSIKLSGGRISFGTGDFFGYSSNIEYARRLNAKKGFKHFSVGAELSFENGSKRPKVINPTFQEFIDKTYYTATNIILSPKIHYYPFSKTFAKGFNISAGISIGYTSQNTEFQSTYIYDPATQMSLRRSYLAYTNEVLFGYRITTGYDLNISKKILTGFRLDFCSYTNGDINTVIAAKLGYNF